MPAVSSLSLEDHTATLPGCHIQVAVDLECQLICTLVYPTDRKSNGGVESSHMYKKPRKATVP